MNKSMDANVATITDADLVLAELLSDPPRSNLIFRVRGERASLAEDILTGELVDAGVSCDLLRVGPEHIASAAVRLVETHLVRVHRELHLDPADSTDCVDLVVITALPQVAS